MRHTANQTVGGPLREVRMGMTVMRAVPCDDHEEWTEGCEHCLTGHEAWLLQMQQDIEEREERWTRKEGRWQRLVSNFSKS